MKEVIYRLGLRYGCLCGCAVVIVYVLVIVVLSVFSLCRLYRMFFDLIGWVVFFCIDVCMIDFVCIYVRICSVGLVGFSVLCICIGWGGSLI